MKSIHSIVITLLLAGGSTYAVGCGDDSNDGLFSGVSNIRISAACKSYCDQAKTCDDGVDVDECEGNCEDNLMNCMADEQEETVQDIEGCSEESCNEFAGCTIGAGLQCTFGI